MRDFLKYFSNGLLVNDTYNPDAVFMEMLAELHRKRLKNKKTNTVVKNNHLPKIKL